MAETRREDETEHARVMLGLLESVERNGAQTQRHLASELGIALGLVNAYLKRCVKKGLVKVKEAPARRYVYYLTPQGFSEKSRLTVEYLSHSLSFFRRARSDCADVLSQVAARGHTQVVLAGISDLAEIARICALESGIEITAVVDPNASVSTFVGVPVVSSFDAVPGAIHAVVVTDVAAARNTFEQAKQHFGADRVWAPSLLGLGTGSSVGLAS